MLFDPFGLNRAPLSGNVAENISSSWLSPSLTVNYAGTPAVENKVVRDIASYGRQIGWLNDIVLELAKHADMPAHVAGTLKQMHAAARQIEDLKKANRAGALEDAIASLNRLKDEQPDVYAALMRGRAAEDARSAMPAPAPAPASPTAVPGH